MLKLLLRKECVSNIVAISVNQLMFKGLRLVMWSLLRMTQISLGKCLALTKALGTAGPEGFGQCQAFSEADLCRATVDRITSLKPDYNMLH